MKLTTAVSIILFIFATGCVSDRYIPEPQYNPKDPTISRLMFFLGKNRKTALFKKLVNKYRLTQKKYGRSGKYYPPDYAYTYWYKDNKIIKLVIAIQRPNTRDGFTTYTGPLPFGLYRCDTHQSAVNKLGRPDSSILDKSILKYNKKHMQITFVNNVLTTITLGTE